MSPHFSKRKVRRWAPWSQAVGEATVSSLFLACQGWSPPNRKRQSSYGGNSPGSPWKKRARSPWLNGGAGERGNRSNTTNGCICWGRCNGKTDLVPWEKHSILCLGFLVCEMGMAAHLCAIMKRKLKRPECPWHILRTRGLVGPAEGATKNRLPV